MPQDVLAELTQPWAVGAADEVATRIASLAAEYGVDEVMVQPIGGAHDDDPLDRVPAREKAVRDLAARLVVPTGSAPTTE